MDIFDAKYRDVLRVILFNLSDIDKVGSLRLVCRKFRDICSGVTSLKWSDDIPIDKRSVLATIFDVFPKLEYLESKIIGWHPNILHLKETLHINLFHVKCTEKIIPTLIKKRLRSLEVSFCLWNSNEIYHFKFHQNASLVSVVLSNMGSGYKIYGNLIRDLQHTYQLPFTITLNLPLRKKGFIPFWKGIGIPLHTVRLIFRSHESYQGDLIFDINRIQTALQPQFIYLVSRERVIINPMALNLGVVLIYESEL